MFVRQKRRPSSRAKSRGRAGSRPGPARARARRAILPAGIEQRHLDVAGLGLIALAAYLGFVLYLSWDGGRVGGALEEGLAFALGKVAYLAPVALALSGAALIAKPLLPAARPLRAGGICLLAGLLLAFAAQTAGLGPDHPARTALFDSSWYPHHGGQAGESMYWATSTLFQRIGAQITAVLLVVVGALLLTGTPIATFVATIGRGLRRAGRGAGDLARTVVGGREGAEGSGLFETLAGQTDVMEDYPDEEEVAPTLAIRDGEEAEDAEHTDAATEDFDAELHELEGGTAETQALGGPQRAGAEGEDPTTSTPMGSRRGVTASEEIDYRLPGAKVLEKGRKDAGPDPRDQDAVGRKLVETLGHFGVEARIVGIVSGPHVSRYELRLAPGTKVKKVTELANDLAYALASTDIRILAPIPGKQAVGVEVPNTRRRLVRLGDIYQGRPEKTSPLVAWLGKGIDGNPVWTDLARMPHVLVAGTTGSGKSGCVNAILSSILMHASPNEVRMVLVDPKQVELNHYEAIPHLLTPVVTSPRLAANVLANLIGEMESRYVIMGEARCRNLAELNRARSRSGEAPLPHILCVIDELADLMMVAPAEVEDSIIRLAQKSRATGIHLVLATQRPSTDIITGTIKVNIPARIAFAVSSQTDSRVILDQGGAESLLGQGDMLFRGAGTSKLARIQGAFVTEDEIARITRHWSRQGEPEFEEELLETREEPDSEGEEGEFNPDRDELLDEAIRLVVQTETASVSMIQRRLRVGYTRAGRLIDMLERRGVISGYEGSKPRQVLVTEADLPRLLGAGGDPEAVPEAEAVGGAPEG
ncbi:MAG: DNA translocase FtsK 4TM domain-containing protein [Solirubrobacterales bacterium]